MSPRRNGARYGIRRIGPAGSGSYTGPGVDRNGEGGADVRSLSAYPHIGRQVYFFDERIRKVVKDALPDVGQVFVSQGNTHTFPLVSAAELGTRPDLRNLTAQELTRHVDVVAALKETYDNVKPPRLLRLPSHLLVTTDDELVLRVTDNEHDMVRKERRSLHKCLNLELPDESLPITHDLLVANLGGAATSLAAEIKILNEERAVRLTLLQPQVV